MLRISLCFADNSLIVWDTTRSCDATAKIKKKMFHYKYPDVDYRWIGYSAMDGGWLEYDEYKSRKKNVRRKKNNNKLIIY